MIPGTHRVRRQSWHLRAGSVDAAFALRARFRAEVEDLLPAFNTVFDAWAPAGEVLRIPRLDLRLRVASLDELARALVEALKREIPPRSPHAARPPSADRLATLLRYLRTGALPWHAVEAEARSVAAELRAAALAGMQAAVAGAPASGPPQETMHYYLRLLQLLPEERWREAAASVARLAPWGVSLPGRGEPTTASPPPRRDEVKAGPEAAIEAISVARHHLSERAALVLTAAVLAAQRRGASMPQLAPADLARELGAEALPELPGAAAELFATRSAPTPSSAERAPPAIPAREAAPPAGTGSEDAAAQAFALIASHAGLVLLHPFLARLLEARGLYAPDRGLEARALPRAAALLHWLATGRDEAYEFELGAVKVLLGLHPDAPLPLGRDLLGEGDREEGEALLRAAIGHWTALKGTSTDGLRLSFLQRRGALREDETGWRLQLEPESFDVLLRRLPWAIGTVKLPWMTRPLYTDWPTL